MVGWQGRLGRQGPQPTSSATSSYKRMGATSGEEKSSSKCTEWGKNWTWSSPTRRLKSVLKISSTALNHWVPVRQQQKGVITNFKEIQNEKTVLGKSSAFICSKSTKHLLDIGHYLRWRGYQETSPGFKKLHGGEGHMGPGNAVE